MSKRNVSLSDFEWCVCSPYGFVGLFYAPETMTGEIPWVCGDCRKPSIPIWEYNLKECEECFCTFSSPWEAICSECTYREPNPRESSSPWISWGVGADLDRVLFDQVTGVIILEEDGP